MEFDAYKMHMSDALIHNLESYKLFPGKLDVICPIPIKDEPWEVAMIICYHSLARFSSYRNQKMTENWMML